jgi:hypothetical protein
MSDRLPRRPLQPVVPGPAVATASITPSELLAEHLSGAPARVVLQGRRNLMARGMVFATVGPDPAAITPVCAISARDLPVVDVLAALAAQDPTGVLVIETQDDAFAFEVDRGRLTGARGLGALDQLEPFVAEVHRRHPQRFGPDEEIGREQPGWMKVARAFVEERVLDQLTLGRAPGTRMTLIRGDVEWLGTRLPPGVGPTLGHVLLEHARRFDELPKVLGVLGDLDRVAVPLAEPGERPHHAPTHGSGEWDFFSDPDPAALAEWNDALAVWSLCDGESSLRELIDGAMLGQFRGLLALRTLAAARCIVLIEPMRRGEPTVVDDTPSAEIIPLRATPELEADPEPPPGESLTGYSIVARRTPLRAGRVEVSTTLRAPEVRPEPRRPTPPVASRRATPVDARRPTPADPVLPRAAPAHPAPPHIDFHRTRGPTPSPDAEDPASSVDVAPEPVDADPSPRAARSLAAARALDGALPSPTTVMIVLGATGIVALVASAVALL